MSDEELAIKQAYQAYRDYMDKKIEPTVEQVMEQVHNKAVQYVNNRWHEDGLDSELAWPSANDAYEAWDFEVHSIIQLIIENIKVEKH